MAKVWVLDTQTKGTGATMVPLERILSKPGSDAVPGFPLPAVKSPLSGPSDAPRPRMFKVVDGVSRQVLADGVDARGAVSALLDIRSFVDATVYVWESNGERWRMLTLAETRALWDHRGRVEQVAPVRERRRKPRPTGSGY